MKILVVDERNCFDWVKKIHNMKLSADYNIEVDFFLAEPTHKSFSALISKGKQVDIVIIHNRIWIDDCDPDDDCKRKFLPSFIKSISPIPVLLIEGSNASCPLQMAYVYQQISKAFSKFSTPFLGAKVHPMNAAWQSKYLEICSLEVFGFNQVGCSLRIPGTSKESKFYKLTQLKPYCA